MSMPEQWILVPMEKPQRFWDGNLVSLDTQPLSETVRHIESCWFERYMRWERVS